MTEFVSLAKPIGRAARLRSFVYWGLAIVSTALVLPAQEAWAACGATNISWISTANTNWGTAANWSPANVPNAATENAIINRTGAIVNPTSNVTASLACVDIVAGTLGTSNGVTLTVTGDYFRTAGTTNLSLTTASTWQLVLGGAIPQTLQLQDPLNNLSITNTGSVTFSRAFTVRNTLSLPTAAGTLYVNGNLNLSSTTTALTIPAGYTVEVASGVTLTALGGITVNGTLKVAAGGSVVVGASKTLQVNYGGALQLNGSAGSLATITSSSAGSYYTFAMKGTLTANYFQISYTTAAGLNVSGASGQIASIAQLDNGDFKYPATGGYAITLAGAYVTLPASMNYITFNDESAFGNTKNVDATTLTSAATVFTMWSGAVGGPSYETDPSNKLTWGTVNYTDITWDGNGNTSWNKTTNWLPQNIPNSITERAIVVSTGSIPNSNLTASIGSLDIQSGYLNTTTGATLTILGPDFKNPTAGSLTVSAGSTWTVNMAGTDAQTFENEDTINYLTVSNNTTVTLNRTFALRNTLTLPSSGGGTLYVNSGLTLQDTASPLVIPAGYTVEVGTGASLSALGGITVNGTLRLRPGSTLSMGSTKTLLVNYGGTLTIAGASGNVATIQASSGTYSITMNGTLNAKYWKIRDLTAAGVNISGSSSSAKATVERFESGEFHFLASSGYAITFAGANINLPASMDNIGFYDDSAYGNVKNIDASTLSGDSTSLSLWSGGIGGAGYENDPGSNITWGAVAGTALTLANLTASGNPSATIGQSSAATLFATFGFALSATDTATDITQVTLSLSGSATSSDVSYIRVYGDTSGGTNCAYDAGVDTQIGSDLTLSGSPASATVTIPTGIVRTSGTTAACIHVLVGTSATAQTDHTLAIQIAETTAVTNVKVGFATSYSFSDTAGPPVSGGSSTILGSPLSTWKGQTNSNFSTNNNWIEGTPPTLARDCTIGSGTSICSLNANGACLNATLRSGGTLDFASTTRDLSVYGALSVESGYFFTNATTGTITLRGTNNQSLQVLTAFPGNVIINNTGAASNNYVNVDASSTINGSLTVTAGILRVTTGTTLTVLGNITVQTGATLDIQPGATLTIGGGSSLTVNSGGTLQIVGSSSSNATIQSNSTSSGITVVVNGTIKAKYYTFSRLGANGVTINSGATIDATYYLLNGSFTYPVANSTNMLRLYRKIPGDNLTELTFDAAGSTATSVKNVYTDSAITPSATLTIDGYTGTLAGSTYQNASASYALNWINPRNTIDLTREDTGPTTVVPSLTYTMGRFGFKQSLAGAAYSNTDITTIKLTMTGTGTANEVSQVRLYYDTSCSSSGGVLKGTGTFSGSPATVTFSGLSGVTVEANATTPPKRCVYVEYDISEDAGDGSTVGVKISASGDLVNSQNYALSSSTPAPITLGNPATVDSNTISWLGGTSTAWCEFSNWSGNTLPTASDNCTIADDGTYQPVISADCSVGSPPTCANFKIVAGTVTMNPGTQLKVYGTFTNNGTFSQGTGTLRFADNGLASSNQTIASSSALGTVTFDKTAGGYVALSPGSLTIGTLTIPSGSNFEFRVAGSSTLTLTNGLSLTAGTFVVQSGGTLLIPVGQSISVAGGTFKTTGVNDAYPQSTTNKALISVSGSGRWGFSATSGTLDLTGFLLDSLNISGLSIGGTTAVTNLNGGQFTNLSTDYANVKALQINTSGTIPSTASNVGWNWGAANSTYVNPPSPLPTEAYQLASSTGCGSQSITFEQWFGDFQQFFTSPVPQTKVSSTNCTITIAASSSAVNLLSLTASGYDASAVINWETGLESDHLGFNVYRSTRPDGGFVQANSALIRNISSSQLARGVYRYVDTGLTNDQPYYYYIEDIANSGAKKQHGPVTTTPTLAAGSVPAASSGTNSGTASEPTPAGGSSGTISAPGAKDLGGGVKILSQTRGSLRVEINLPVPAYTTSSWNASYQTVSIPGFSSTSEPGLPELLEKSILIPVDADLVNTNVVSSGVTLRAPESRVIAPAPAWTANSSGTLIPSWSPSASAYAIDAYAPSAYYEVAPQTVAVGTRRYVKILVKPVSYNPVQQLAKAAQKLVIDIGLDAAPWTLPTIDTTYSLSPSAIENNLRIRFDRAGVYELVYEDLDATGVLGPFDGADTTLFRLYYGTDELPIEVTDSAGAAAGAFTSGDTIRFYLPFEKFYADTENEAVLTLQPITSGAPAPSRIQDLNADPSLQSVTDEVDTVRFATAEQDLFPMFDRPLMPEGQDYEEHVYWSRIYAQNGAVDLTTGIGPAGSSAALPIALPHLNPNASDNVVVKVEVQGASANAKNVLHHVGIRINHMSVLAGDATFAGDAPTTLSFSVPSYYFTEGTNTIHVVALADYFPAGDWELIYINKVEAKFRAHRVADGGLAYLMNYRLGKSLNASGFTDPFAITVWDITNPSETTNLVFAPPMTPDSDGTYTVEFATSAGASGELGRKFVAFEPAAVLQPISLSLAHGSRSPLRSPSNGADLLIIGPMDLIVWSSDLIDQRENQGLRVAAVPVEQIYAEFSHGVRSASAIREFIEVAASNWTQPAPKYLLFLGTASYDPGDRLGVGTQGSPLPIIFKRGDVVDFGCPDCYARDTVTGITKMAVGWIPAKTADELGKYIDKIRDYESGSRATTSANSRELVFIAGEDINGLEEFTRHTQDLSVSSNSNSALSARLIDENALGTAAARQEILDAFDDAPLVMTFFGHGAEDRWGSAFFNADADALNNTRLPVAIGLNCLNAYFYDADPTWPDSLARRLILSDGGAIAFWGSTTMTYPSAQLRLAAEFFNRLAAETRLPAHGVRIGDLTTAAKISTGVSNSTQDTLDSFVLIGDPSLLLPSASFTPGIVGEPVTESGTSGETPTSSPSEGTTSGTSSPTSSSKGDSDDEDSGGFFSCGTTRSGGSGGPSSGAAAEMALLFAFIFLFRRFAMSGSGQAEPAFNFSGGRAAPGFDPLTWALGLLPSSFAPARTSWRPPRYPSS